MRASKVGLLVLILVFGGLVETAWFVENRFDVGPSGCRVLGWRPYGPSFSFEEQQRHPVTAATALEVENAFGAVRVKKGEPGQVQVLLRKVVFRRTEEEARAFAQNIRLNVVAEGQQGRQVLILHRCGELLQNQIQLEQPPAAIPLQPVPVDRAHHTVRFTSSSLMWLIALVGFRFFGHTSTQFMMVWQRNRR